MATANNGATSILKEYLVSIGYTVNKQSHKDAKDSVDVIGSSVDSLNEKLDNPLKSSLTTNLDKVDKLLWRVATRGLSVFTKTTLAAGAAAAEFGYRMDSLYHAAQRSNTSTTYLYALGKAFSQIGLSADDARKRTAEFHSFMVNNPQMRAVLKFTLDVDANSETAYLDTIKKLGQIPNEFQRNRVAGLFGIDGADLKYLLLNMKDLEEAFRESQESTKRMGTNLGDVVEGGEKFNKIWRHSLDIVEQLSFVIRNKLVQDYEGLFLTVQRNMETLGAYINTYGVVKGLLLMSWHGNTTGNFKTAEELAKIAKEEQEPENPEPEKPVGKYGRLVDMWNEAMEKYASGMRGPRDYGPGGSLYNQRPSGLWSKPEVLQELVGVIRRGQLERITTFGRNTDNRQEIERILYRYGLGPGLNRTDLSRDQTIDLIREVARTIEPHRVPPTSEQITQAYNSFSRTGATGGWSSPTETSLGAYQEELEMFISSIGRGYAGDATSYGKTKKQKAEIFNSLNGMGIGPDVHLGELSRDQLIEVTRMLTRVMVPNSAITADEVGKAYDSLQSKRAEATEFVLNQTNVYNITGNNATDIAGKVSRQQQQDTANATRYMGQGTR